MVARRIRALLSTKLGQCPYCMRWSALGTLVGWIGVGFLALARAELIAFLIALAIALGFTTLIGLHLAVFTARVLRAGRGIDADRRQFLRTFVKVGSAVFAIAVSGSIFRRTALAGENTGNSVCAKLCDALFPPGVRRGCCKSDGAHGRGICFTGTCVPSPEASEGFKPKSDPEAKLQALIDGDAIPSTIAGVFFHLARRFQQGNAPANELEQSTFGIFERLAPDTRAVLECAVSRFDRLSPDRRSRAFGSPFAVPIEAAISVEDLRAWFAQELIARHGDCKDERPGQVRPIEFQDPIEGNTVIAPIPWICRLNGRRTAEFVTEGGGRLGSGGG